MTSTNAVIAVAVYVIGMINAGVVFLAVTNSAIFWFAWPPTALLLYAILMQAREDWE